ncbi:dihydroneopterin aldolase [Sphingomicrobium lutaoense]|uniref:dihydroneopterin aldolase n=1 Tax=Sphingomicrobium lutaoense TaxID=515949 RepID=A0A839Z006_9SPHN|nr:dihydroneopterin aldolase [Sphingomicrobium lutaoense]MBB3763367.1 dihydroneopterin aldolase [Sphingomicrobium lutaoense]
MTLDGLPRLEPRRRRILLENLEVRADIGFHDFEIGSPQRLLISVEILLDEGTDPTRDEKEDAWNYDFVREEILAVVESRRFNLQETLVRSIFERIGSVKGVKSLRVRSMKPDIYDDADGVGIEYSSD